jgi:hypothetical protein
VGCLFLHDKLPERLRDQRTHDVIKLAIGIVVVMTSLVLGLLIASSKSSFDAVDRDVHSFATQLILLDRQMKLYGPETRPAHGLLTTYVERALEGTWPKNGRPVVIEDKDAGLMLDEVIQSLREVNPQDATHKAFLDAALQRARQVEELRWVLIAQSDRGVSQPLIFALVGWLALIFASFGFNAPRNPVVIVMLLLCTASIAAAVYLILDMATPFDGPLKVSPAPLVRALAFMRQG